MFKRFFILGRESETYDFIFPNSVSNSNKLEQPFLFPCSNFEKYEHGTYVVVLTGISGSKNFITTRYIKEVQISVAFESDHPWFEIVYTIVNNVVKYQLYLRPKWGQLEKYLTDLLLLPHPEPGLVFYIPAADFDDSAVKIVVPMKSRQKPYPVFLKSLHKQLQFDDWIIIFECLLLERWIVFHSRHLNRVTSCIFASLALIFPLEWVHLIFPCLSEGSINCLGCPSPFIAGIHSCFLDNVLLLLNPGTLIVNIDEGTLNFVTDNNDVFNEDDHIPRSLVNFLYRSYNDSESRLCQALKYYKDLTNAFDLVMNGFLNTMAVLLGKYKQCSTWNGDRYVINKLMLAQSRGDLLQPFLTKLIESQMVYQFLDDRINTVIPNKTENITFFVDDLDDFEEACKAMNKWHPDHYSEVFANITSRSRRKINDIAIRVRDIAKKSTFGTETINNGNSKSHWLSNDKYQSTNDSPPTGFPRVEFPELDVSRNKWITFDDNDIDNAENKDFIQFEHSRDQLYKAKTKNMEEGVPVALRDFDPLYQ